MLATGMSHYNVSKHLRILREAGLLAQEKNCQQRLYAIAPTLAEHLAKNASVLDLGCCQFDFKRPAT
jgi:DNA-binding transcriptional ArsR family regulator